MRTGFVALLPAIVFLAIMGSTYNLVTAPPKVDEMAWLVEMGAGFETEEYKSEDGGGLEEPPGAEEVASEPAPTAAPAAAAPAAEAAAVAEPVPAPTWYWVTLGVTAVLLLAFYAIFNWARLEVFKMLLGSFFPLAVLILAVLGSIVFGLATPTEAAAVGGIGGAVLAAA